MEKISFDSPSVQSYLTILQGILQEDSKYLKDLKKNGRETAIEETKQLIHAVLNLKCDKDYLLGHRDTEL